MATAIEGGLLDAIHRLLADASVAVTVAAIVWALILLATGRSGGRRFEHAQATVVSMFVTVAASGALLLLTGSAPRDGLHIFYAAVALMVIPLARSLFGRAGPRHSSTMLLVALVVLGAVTYRLFTTG